MCLFLFKLLGFGSRKLGGPNLPPFINLTYGLEIGPKFGV